MPKKTTASKKPDAKAKARDLKPKKDAKGGFPVARLTVRKQGSDPVE